MRILEYDEDGNVIRGTKRFGALLPRLMLKGERIE